MKTEQLDFEGYTFEILRKKIKHIYFRVYPSKKKIVVSAPVYIDPETLNRAILSKSAWLKEQIKKGAATKPDSVKSYITGEEIRFKGDVYSLNVRQRQARPDVCVTGDGCIDLMVKPGHDVNARKKVIHTWYRKELKRSTGKLIKKWQPIMGVTVNEFNVRKMKTRWGSCNIRAKRIWLNFALIKLAEPFLEYVIVHEMAHLLERKHNARFKGLMDQFIPEWRQLKKELNLFIL